MIGTTNIAGEFRQAALNEPLAVAVGDTVQVVGNQVIVSRNGSVIAVRLITGQIEAAPLGAERDEVIDRVMFFWRPPVAGIIVTLTSVIKNQATGVVRFRFSDGSEREYANDAAAKAEVEYLDTEATTAQDALIHKTFRNSPDGTNLENMVGASFSVDFFADRPFVLTQE